MTWFKWSSCWKCHSSIFNGTNITETLLLSLLNTALTLTVVYLRFDLTKPLCDHRFRIFVLFFVCSDHISFEDDRPSLSFQFLMTCWTALNPTSVVSTLMFPLLDACIQLLDFSHVTTFFICLIHNYSRREYGWKHLLYVTMMHYYIINSNIFRYFILNIGKCQVVLQHLKMVSGDMVMDDPVCADGHVLCFVKDLKRCFLSPDIPCVVFCFFVYLWT